MRTSCLRNYFELGAWRTSFYWTLFFIFFDYTFNVLYSWANFRGKWRFKLKAFCELEKINPFDECVANQFEKDIVLTTRDASQNFLLKKTMIFWLITLKPLKKYVKRDQNFIIKIIENLHVNDITSWCSSIDKGIEFYQKVILTMIFCLITLKPVKYG